MLKILKDAADRLPLDKLPLDKLPIDKLPLDDARALMKKIDTKKIAPVALMVARRSWPLAIALGVGAAAFTAWRYSRNHKAATA